MIAKIKADFAFHYHIHKFLRKITNAPFYVSNQTHPLRPQTSFRPYYAIDRYNKIHEKLSYQPNPLAQNIHSLHIPGNPTRRLNRHWPRKLLQRAEWYSEAANRQRNPPTIVLFVSLSYMLLVVTVKKYTISTGTLLYFT